MVNSEVEGQELDLRVDLEWIDTNAESVQIFDRPRKSDPMPYIAPEHEYTRNFGIDMLVPDFDMWAPDFAAQNLIADMTEQNSVVDTAV